MPKGVPLSPGATVIGWVLEFTGPFVHGAHMSVLPPDQAEGQLQHSTSTAKITQGLLSR